jgi:3-isopropylmalate/(R)-2-methylmalate dehydratase small subunit
VKTTIEGLAYVLGDDIDTDQIIPVMHLVYSLADPQERRQYGRFALSGVPESKRDGPFVDEDAWNSRYSIIVAGRNFGSGSSREQAPASLEIAGVEAIIAESYARIFYRNTVAGGRFLPLESKERLTSVTRTGDRIRIDLEHGRIENLTRRATHELHPLGDVLPILEAGGIFAYARKAGLIAQLPESTEENAKAPTFIDLT